MNRIAVSIVATGIALVLVLQVAELKGWLPDLLEPQLPVVATGAVEDLLCGPKSLHTAFSLLGIPTTTDQMLQDCEVTATGVEFGELLRVAVKNGIEARLDTLDWDSLVAEHAVHVLFVDGGHYVTVDSRNGDQQVRLFDPGKVARKITAADLADRWNGEALLLRGEPSKPLVFDSLWHDAGFVTGDTHRFEVAISNPGLEPMAVSIAKTSCSCTSASVSADVIPPHGSALMIAEVRLAEKRGVFQESVDLACGQQKLQVWLCGGTFAKAMARRDTFLGVLVDGTSFSHSIIIHDPGEKSLFLDESMVATEASVVESQSHIPLKTKVVRIDEDNLYSVDIHGALFPVRVGDYQVNISGVLPFQGGDSEIAGQLSFRTELPVPYNEYAIAIKGRIRCRVAPVPAAVLLPATESAVVKHVVLTDRLGENLQLISSKAGISEITVESVTPNDAKQIKLEIRFPKGTQSLLTQPTSVVAETSLGRISIPVIVSSQ